MSKQTTEQIVAELRNLAKDMALAGQLTTEATVSEAADKIEELATICRVAGAVLQVGAGEKVLSATPQVPKHK